MLRSQMRVCLLVCLASLLCACKKDQIFEKPGSEPKTVLIDHRQERVQRCHTDQKMASFYANHQEYRAAIKEARTLVSEQMRAGNARSGSPLPLYTVPVHVIVVHQPNHQVGSGTNISISRIRSQIDALNLDFLRQNPDAVRTPSVFPASSCQIKFCLASKDPGGSATDGVSRYATTSNFDDYELDIKGATTWDPERYLNIWVAPDIDGLGYAYLPSPNDLPDRNEDGVVVLTAAFGGPNSGAEAPFDLGRTLTHEVGHYLGLDHIWGEGCNIDDGIHDTPDQREENIGCPSHPSPSCNNQGDMFMNYMDYSDDDCLNAFSAGQATYMRHILESSRAALIQPGLSECTTETQEPSCSDGIRNGKETGVDCGGPDCPPCPVAVLGDAGIIDLISSQIGSGCSQRLDLTFKLRNYGESTLRSTKIVAAIGNMSLRSESWSGSIPAGGFENIVFEDISIPTGVHSIQVYTDLPNGQQDAKPENDASTTSVSFSGGMMFTLNIQPDEYGSEIKWRIKNEHGEIVVRGGGYDDFDLSLIEEKICLPSGCYKLIVSDTYGDGICCSYGEGWYELINDSGDLLIFSDGYYGYREATSFCVEDRKLNKVQIERDIRTALPVKKKAVQKTPSKEVN